MQFGSRVGPVEWEIHSLRLKNGCAQDDKRRLIVKLPPPLSSSIIVGIAEAGVADARGIIGGRRDRLKDDRGLREVENVREIIGWNIGIAQRRQIKSSLNKFQDASKIMCDM